MTSIKFFLLSFLGDVVIKYMLHTLLVGDITMAILLSGQPLKYIDLSFLTLNIISYLFRGSPFKLTRHGVDASKCLVSGEGLQYATQYEASSFILSLMDASSMPISTGNVTCYFTDRYATKNNVSFTLFLN